MNLKTALHAACCLCLCVIPLWSAANTGSIENNFQKASDKNPKQNDAQFTKFIDDILAVHPSLLSAQAEMEAAKLALLGSRNAVSNPELQFNAENTDVTTYQLGIAQTIDWHNKKTANEGDAKLLLKSTQIGYLATYERIASELLFAIVQYLSSRDAGLLAKKRVSLMQQFVKIANSRQSAGDITQIESDTAQLALAEAIVQHSESSSNLISAQINLMSLTGRPVDESFPFPNYLPLADKVKQDIKQLVTHHPEVVLAQLNVQLAKSQTHLVDIGRRANPTLGLSVGKEGGNTLVAASFSMPLMVRNNFNNNVASAQQLELQAEQHAISLYRQVFARATLSQKRYSIMTNAWDLWQSNGKKVLNNHQANLETLWRSGEINTTEYLIQLKQNLDTQLSGSTLQGNVWVAWLEWLSATGQVNTWLKDKKTGGTN